jgi:hypothetical protein
MVQNLVRQAHTLLDRVLKIGLIHWQVLYILNFLRTTSRWKVLYQEVKEIIMCTHIFHRIPKILISNVFKISLLLILIYSLVGCNGISSAQTPTPTLELVFLDKSILTDKPCALPCWYGLTVGKSTEDDIYKTIPMLSFVDSNTINPNEGETYFDVNTRKNLAAKGITLSWKNPPSRWGGFTVFNNVLVMIVYFPNYTFTLGELINHIGKPDYIRAISEFEGGQMCDIFFVDKARSFL